MNKIKLIATDLDNTILYQGKWANNADQKLLTALQSNGYGLTLVTGQSYDRAAITAKALQIDKFVNKIVCQNGAYITTVDCFRPEFIDIIEPIVVKNIIEACNRHQIIIYMIKYDEFDCIYYNDIKPSISIKSKQNKRYINVNAIKQPDFSRITHMWTSLPSYGYERHLIWMSQEFNQKISVTSSYTDNKSKLVFMVSKYNTTKGDKLKKLVETLQIQTDQVLVFGDGGNDVSMFKLFQHSCAVGNAEPWVKSQARYVTKDCRNAGVSNFIKTMYFNQGVNGHETKW